MVVTIGEAGQFVYVSGASFLDMKNHSDAYSTCGPFIMYLALLSISYQFFMEVKPNQALAFFFCFCFLYILLITR